MLGLLAILVAATASAQEFRGETASGARYLIVMPPTGWSAGQPLVLYNHGYDSNPPDDPSIPEGLKGIAAVRGFAIAASGYSLRGWALFGTGQDHRELYQTIREQFGEPGQVYLVGGSLGGLIALQQAEQPGLGAITGVYALCAPLGGSKVWDQALDVRLSYDTICEGVSGGALPRSDELPFLLPASAVNDNQDSESTLAEVALAASRCLGVGINPVLQSSGMRERRQRLLATNRIPEDFLEVQLYYATFGLSDLYFDPGKLDRMPAFDNRDVDYGDAALNAAIRRVASEPLARLRLKRHFSPTGQLTSSTARVLTTWTSGDGLVVPEHASALLGRLDEGRWTRALVREGTGSHCGYSEAEVLAGFDALIDWSRDQIAKPDATQLNRYCQAQNQAGVPGACRYENFAQPAPLTTRIRPRVTSEPMLDARWSGQWFDPSRPGEGYVLELLPDGRALLAWYTYPNLEQVGEQIWVFGEGRIQDNTIVFENAFTTRGGQFGRNWDFFDVSQIPFGPVRFVFDRCGHGFMEYQGTPAYGARSHEIVQLTHLGNDRCAGPLPASNTQVRFNGAWSGRALEGLFVNIQSDGRAFITWYSYDLIGGQTWLFGEGVLAGDSVVVEHMLVPQGTRFGALFDPSQVRFQRWGRMQIRFHNCAQATVQYDAGGAGYGVGVFPFNRLTQPLGVSCN